MAQEQGGRCDPGAFIAVNKGVIADEGVHEGSRLGDKVGVQILPSKRSSRTGHRRKLHSELGQSPLERFQQDEASTARPVDPTELRQAFLHRVTRRVTKTASVSFQGNRYQVPAFPVSQTVELRYDPFDLTRLEVWYDNTFLELAVPQEVRRTVHAYVTPDPQPNAPPPRTGADYLALLRQERERLLRETLGQLRFTRLGAPDADQPPSDIDEEE